MVTVGNELFSSCSTGGVLSLGKFGLPSVGKGGSLLSSKRGVLFECEDGGSVEVAVVAEGAWFCIGDAGDGWFAAVLSSLQEGFGGRQSGTSEMESKAGGDLKKVSEVRGTSWYLLRRRRIIFIVNGRGTYTEVSAEVPKIGREILPITIVLLTSGTFDAKELLV